VAAVIPAFADLTNRRLRGSASGELFTLPTPFHQDKLYLSIQPMALNPGGDESERFTVLDGNGYSVSVLVTETDGDTLAGPYTSFAVDTSNGTANPPVAGLVNLNTTEMATAFASASTTSINAVLYIKLTGSGGDVTTIKQAITIERTYITSGTPSANPLTEYYTKAEIDAQCVKFTGNPDGATVTFTNGVYSTIFGCNADGSNASNA
jgi:hypothetical protein